MNKTTTAVLLSTLLAGSTGLRAGSVSSSISGESLVSVRYVEAVSVGLNFDSATREVVSGSDTRDLESRAYSFFLGYDITKWFTLFATLGASQARLDESGEYGDPKARWSIGANANIWHVEIENPPLFTGRVSLKPALEFAGFSSDNDGTTLDWTDFSGALFLYYEKIIDDPKYSIMQHYGYNIYAGPAFSTIDGEAGTGVSFSENNSIGLIGGIDFFFNRFFSLGAQVQSFDDLSFGGNCRYHF